MQRFIDDVQAVHEFTNQELGAWGEEQVVQYFQELGYEILDRNWRYRLGELDLVVYDPRREAIVAVEVKTRRQVIYGSPEESITPAKLKRLRVLLMAWMHEKGQHSRRIEIDILALLVLDNFLYLSHMKGL